MFFNCLPCCGVVRFCRCGAAYPLESNLLLALNLSSFAVDPSQDSYRDERRYWSDAFGSCSVSRILEEVQSLFLSQTFVGKDLNGSDIMRWRVEETSGEGNLSNNLAFNCRPVGETFSFVYSRNITAPDCLSGSIVINPPLLVNVLLSGYVTGPNSSGSFCELFTTGSTEMIFPDPLSRITVTSQASGNFTWANIGGGTATLSVSNLP